MEWRDYDTTDPEHDEPVRDRNIGRRSEVCGDNEHGQRDLLRAKPYAGRERKDSQLEYYIAAIGGCTAIKTQIDLTALGTDPASVEVQVDCTRSEELPQILKTIHLTFSLKGRLDDAKVAAVIRDVMTLHCPVAVMAAASAKVTWEHRIVPE